MEARTPAGPLEPRWGPWTLEPPRAGAPFRARVALENGGTATWRSFGSEGLQLAYHWLDPRGNAIVWDGRRTPLPHPVAPGEAIELTVHGDAPRPPGAYVLRFDLVEELRFWLSDVGAATLDVEVAVAPRIAERRLRVVVHGGASVRTEAALAAQAEALVADGAEAVAHLVAGCEPAPDWSRRVLDAHAEGWAAVGSAVEPVGGLLARQRARRRLGRWAPGGRNPRFDGPLLLPSLLEGLQPASWQGLPTYDGPEGLFDGGAVVRLPTRSGRRPS